MIVDPAVSAGTTSEQRLRPLQEIHDAIYEAAGYENGGDLETIARGLVDEIELLRTERDQVPAACAERVAGLCHWTQDRGEARAETHDQFHYGSPCPYESMAAVLRGEPDPRDDCDHGGSPGVTSCRYCVR